MIAVNERGRVIGEDHPLARFSDREVELMRTMHETKQLGLTAIARAFETDKKTVWKIVTYRMRNQHADRFVRRAVAMGELQSVTC